MNKYLVIQLARFGDLIQTKRLVASLLAEQAEVHLCLDHSLATLASLIYPSCKVHSITAHASGLNPASGALAILGDNRRVFSKLQTQRFDKVYNLNFSALNFRLASLFEPDQVRGYSASNGQELVATWPSMAMRWSRNRRLGINLMDFWGAYSSRPIAPDKVNPPAKAHGGGMGVVLAGRETRRSLPINELSKIVSLIALRDKVDRVVLLGSDAETVAGRELMRSLPPKISAITKDYSGKTDWKGLVELIGELDCLITPDTGTMHLAAHLGVPVQGFFLSSAWCFETGPYGLGHTVNQAVADCLPCLESAPCSYDVKCLDPLISRGMMRFLTTGKPEHCPAGVVSFASSFDELGLTFTPRAGLDVQEQQRRDFRAFVAPHAKANVPRFEGAQALNLAAMLYNEQDWMV